MFKYSISKNNLCQKVVYTYKIDYQIEFDILTYETTVC